MINASIGGTFVEKCREMGRKFFRLGQPARRGENRVLPA